MITLRGVDVRVGADILLTDLSFILSPGDRIGLVGRNGAGKTTLLRVLSGDLPAAAGTVLRTGSLGCLHQESRAGKPGQSAIDRILSARQLGTAERALRAAETELAAADPSGTDRAMRRYADAEARFQSLGGYSAAAEAAQIAAGLGLDTPTAERPLATLSGGQRRRVELARILFAGHQTLLLDEPTNHLDAKAVTWLRQYLRGYPGALVLISHDVRLIDEVANRIFAVDPARKTIDIHNAGWQHYLEHRDAAERRRLRERHNAERKAAALQAQAAKMHARSATAVAAKNLVRRAERLLAGTEPVRRSERVASIKLPDPLPSGRIPLGAVSLAKSYGALRVLRGLDLAVDRGSRTVVLGPNGAGKTTLLRILAGLESADSGRVVAGHGLRLGYFAQEHETLRHDETVLANLRDAAPQLDDQQARAVLGSFLFSGHEVDKPVRVLSGGEKTRLALAALVHSGANVLLLDEPTNNLDPASRTEVLNAVGQYPGAILMVTHDRQAVVALNPDRVILLPDGDEDLWDEGYLELVSLD